MEKIIDSISNYVLYLIEIFVQPNTTKALFQAAVVLGSAFIIGAKDQGAFLYKEEMAAYEVKLKYEEKAKVEDLSKVDCLKQKEYIADCKLAQHKINSIQGITKVFMAVMHLIYMFFVFSSAGSIASFFLRPLFSNSEAGNSTQSRSEVSIVETL